MITCTGLSSTQIQILIQLFQGGSVDTGSVYDSYLSFSADDGSGGGSANKQ